MKEYRYKIIDMDGNEELATTVDCIELMQIFNQPCDYASEKEDRAILEGHWYKLHIGNDDDHYEIVRLAEIHVQDEDGEIRALSDSTDHRNDIAGMERTYRAIDAAKFWW